MARDCQVEAPGRSARRPAPLEESSRMDVFRTVTAPERYGPLQADFQYDLRAGLTVLIGPNNAGKSALLQLLFRERHRSVLTV